MDGLLRCRVCGYIMKESRKDALCPACGVKRAAFEPYKETMSARRALVLSLHLHGIAMHFPQAVITLLFVSLAGVLLLPADAGGELSVVARALAWIFPLSVLATIGSGLIDAYTRFKRINTRIILIKITAAACLFVISCGILALGCRPALVAGNALPLLALSVCGLAVSIVLGKLGSSLVCTKVPG